MVISFLSGVVAVFGSAKEWPCLPSSLAGPKDYKTRKENRSRRKSTGYQGLRPRLLMLLGEEKSGKI
jgi:hypothetical protein